MEVSSPHDRAFAVVDVFSHDAFKGNPVAVILDADGIEDEMMATLSRWTNLSETTFVGAPSVAEADYSLRIFTPSTELPVAGHHTLGSCRAWLAAGGKPKRPGIVVQDCGVGLIEIRVGDGATLSFAAPPLVTSGPLNPAMTSEIVALLGIEEAAVVAAAHVDNGPGWIGILLETADEVLALEPADSPYKIGVAGFHPPGSAAAYEVRAFFPEGARSIEDPVTGSLNASMAQWLLDEGRVVAPYVASQGGRLGRTGRIAIEVDATGQVWVGGAASVRVRGSLVLTGTG